jgi:hypothetical protein
LLQSAPCREKPDIDIPGLLQNVIVRGIERREIFLDDSDRSMFVNRFSALLEETGPEGEWAKQKLLRCQGCFCGFVIFLSRVEKRLLITERIDRDQADTE